MASPLQQVVASIQTNDYIALVIITAVVYDYVLTFSEEVEYIWNKPWALVPTLFVLARYFGLCFAISSSTVGTSFLAGPTMVFLQINGNQWGYIVTNFYYFSCETTIVLYYWSCWIFIGAAELVMIIRVWAMYYQSRLVLSTLLTIYTMEMITLLTYYVVLDVLWGFNNGTGYLIVQALQFSSCTGTESFGPIWLAYLPACLQMTLGLLMCFLTAIQFTKELLQVYKARKQVKLNHYMKRLARDGMVYFMVSLAFSVLSMIIGAGVISHTWLIWPGSVLQIVPPITLVPRFILGLRELHAHDLRGRRGSYIDTAFGLGSEPAHGATRSAIVFADPRGNEGDELGNGQSDEIEMDTIQEVHRTSSRA